MKSTKSWTIGKFVVQVAWPELMYRSSAWGDDKAHDFFIGLQTALRVQWQKDYFQIGFCILGFGIGFDWWKNGDTAE
jgi:hypothetical protein